MTLTIWKTVEHTGEEPFAFLTQELDVVIRSTLATGLEL